MDVGAVGLEQIGYPVPAVGGLDDHLGIWARLRHRPRHRPRSFATRVVETFSPAALMRTITDRRR
ncbi:MAG TPA: hypothetical protein VE466_13840 [Acidimicrobiales bacterium]|nr:hypothetical protein [Acidimicrobiales bacterium]